MKNILVIIVMVFMFFMRADAGTATAMDFLKIGASAREAAMGGAACALAGGSGAIRYNPSGIAMLRSREASFSHAAWFEGISYESLNAVLPVEEKATVGANVSIMRYGDINCYDAGGAQLASSAAYDVLLVLSAARNVSKWDEKQTGLFAGANLKFMQENLCGRSASVLAVDAGCTYVPGEKILGGDARAGLVVENFGQNVKFQEKEARLPLCLRFGGAYSRGVPGGRLLLSADGNVGYGENFYLCAGGEYEYAEFVALRLGWVFGRTVDSGLCVGLGIKIKGKNGFNLRIDHALVPYAVFGNTHRVSVSVEFQDGFTSRECSRGQ